MARKKRRLFNKQLMKFSTKLIIWLSVANLLISSITALVTYRIHLSLFNEEVSRQYYMTTEQVLARLDSRVNDMYRITDYITLNPSVKLAISEQAEQADSYERMKIEQVLDDQIYQVRLDAPEMVGLRIYDLKENQISLGSFAGSFYSLDPQYLDQMVRRLDGTGGEYVWSRPGRDDYQQEGSANWILAGRLMRSIDLDTYGMMLILFNTSLFEAHLKNLRSQQQENVFLFDHDGNFLYSLNELADEVHPVLADMPNMGSTVREEQGVSYMYTRQVSEKVGFTLVSKVSLSQIQSKSQIILKVAVLSALASLVCMGLIIAGISRMLLRPLGSLVRGMKRIREGKFDTRVQIRTKDELGYIGDSFNNMTAYIETLIYEVYERKINEKEAELKAIQAQLNPHFLYNTLGMFFWKFYMLGDEKSARLVTNLSEMLQYTLEPVQDMTTLRDEIKQIRNYLEIQKARYPEALTMDIEVPEELLDCQVIRLLIQPLVENTFIHAFRNKKTDRYLKIHAFTGPVEEGESPDFLIIEIGDNGEGMSEETLSSVLQASGVLHEKRKSIGTASVIRRIELLYGAPYGVEIESTLGEGTLVRLKLPYRLQLESENP
ncbi:sensor histidine kinase [Paenibacillus senegalimassiliensis]|uniref:sensor histidine kinase n=1 Tax=Paenibacillus senegalimassiliensis TaxID=1737426 RepID=UPI00073E6A39|nr:histidine kinase [Paenibacillus senegalimassiliensis]